MLLSMRETCLPQKHMSWSLKFVTMGDYSAILLVTVALFDATVNGCLFFSGNGRIVEVFLPESLELTDLVSKFIVFDALLSKPNLMISLYEVSTFWTAFADSLLFGFGSLILVIFLLNLSMKWVLKSA